VPVCCVNTQITLRRPALPALGLDDGSRANWDVHGATVDGETGALGVKRRLPEVSCTCSRALSRGQAN
jgi:hypothetical protein